MAQVAMALPLLAGRLDKWALLRSSLLVWGEAVARTSASSSIRARDPEALVLALMALPGREATSLRNRNGVPNLGALWSSPPLGKRGIARPVPDLEAPMANKPFKDITDRGFFAGLIMAALAAES